MRKLTITFLTIVFCLTSSIAFSETVAPIDLVKRNGLVYKKFTNIPFTGSVVGFDKDGYFSKGIIKDGEKEGVWEFYHDNGQLREKRTYKIGFELTSLYYDESGQLRNGVVESYYQNGQLQEKRTYKDGKKVGVWEYYEQNGELSSKTTYKDSKKIKEEKF